MSVAPVDVSILIVAFNSERVIGPCLRSLEANRDARLTVRIVVVDNASHDGTAALIRGSFPNVELIAGDENQGFAGGCNLGWRHVRAHHPQSQFLVLLNPDTQVASGWLHPLVDHLLRHPHVSIVQPKLRLLEGQPPRETTRINTAGNRSHYLGFGFTMGYGHEDRGQFDQPRAIDFASGAALVARSERLPDGDLFDDEMFMYLEDADLSWRQRIRGYEVHYVPAGIVYHEHEPAGTVAKHCFHLEKNRWLLVLSYYRLPTLLLLMPALIAADFGVLIWAAKQGVAGEKCRVWKWLLRASTWRLIRTRRKAIREGRSITDRTLLKSHSGTIDLSGVGTGVATRIGNALLAAYWALAHRIIFW